MFHEIKAENLDDKLNDPDFVQCKHVLVIKDPKNLPGFSHNLPNNLGEGSDIYKNALDGYAGNMHVRHYDKDWKVRLKYWFKSGNNKYI